MGIFQLHASALPYRRSPLSLDARPAASPTTPTVSEMTSRSRDQAAAALMQIASGDGSRPTQLQVPRGLRLPPRTQVYRAARPAD
jgi:hypothetical protein